MEMSYLYELDDSILSDLSRSTLNMIKEAINDWPETVSSTEDFILQLKTYLSASEITYSLVSLKIATLHSIKDSWVAESLQSVADIIKLNNCHKLDDIWLFG